MSIHGINKGGTLGKTLGKYDEAIKACDEAIKLDPTKLEGLVQQRHCS